MRRLMTMVLLVLLLPIAARWVEGAAPNAGQVEEQAPEPEGEEPNWGATDMHEQKTCGGPAKSPPPPPRFGTPRHLANEDAVLGEEEAYEGETDMEDTSGTVYMPDDKTLSEQFGVEVDKLDFEQVDRFYEVLNGVLAKNEGSVPQLLSELKTEYPVEVQDVVGPDGTVEKLEPNEQVAQLLETVFFDIDQKDESNMNTDHFLGELHTKYGMEVDSSDLPEVDTRATSSFELAAQAEAADAGGEVMYDDFEEGQDAADEQATDDGAEGMPLLGSEKATDGQAPMRLEPAERYDVSQDDAFRLTLDKILDLWGLAKKSSKLLELVTEQYPSIPGGGKGPDGVEFPEDENWTDEQKALDKLDRLWMSTRTDYDKSQALLEELEDLTKSDSHASYPADPDQPPPPPPPPRPKVVKAGDEEEEEPELESIQQMIDRGERDESVPDPEELPPDDDSNLKQPDHLSQPLGPFDPDSCSTIVRDTWPTSDAQEQQQNQDLCAKVVATLLTHNPHKLSSLSKVLFRYKTKKGDLLKDLEAKYGAIEEPGETPEDTWTAKIHQFYQEQHKQGKGPAKTEAEARIMAKVLLPAYTGREEQLLEDLKTKGKSKPQPKHDKKASAPKKQKQQKKPHEETMSEEDREALAKEGVYEAEDQAQEPMTPEEKIKDMMQGKMFEIGEHIIDVLYKGKEAELLEDLRNGKRWNTAPRARINHKFIEQAKDENGANEEPTIQQKCADEMAILFFGKKTFEGAQQFLADLKAAYQVPATIGPLPWAGEEDPEWPLPPAIPTVVAAGSSTTPRGVKVNVYGPAPRRCADPSDVAAVGTTLSVHYVGKIDDSSSVGEKGHVFDSSRVVGGLQGGGDPIEFPLGEGEVIEGWDEGMMGLCQGDNATLVIPPALGYGDDGAGNDIPPGATLHFDVEIIAVTPTAEAPGEAAWLEQKATLDAEAEEDEAIAAQQEAKKDSKEEAKKRKDEAKRKAKAARQKPPATEAKPEPVADASEPTEEDGDLGDTGSKPIETYTRRTRKPGDKPLKNPVDKTRDYEKDPMTQDELRSLVDYALETGDLSAFVNENGAEPSLDELKEMDQSGSFGEKSSKGGLYEGYDANGKLIKETGEGEGEAEAGGAEEVTLKDEEDEEADDSDDLLPDEKHKSGWVSFGDGKADSGFVE